MGWGATWQGHVNKGEPQDRRNLVLSYQVAILTKDGKGQWRYGDDIYHADTAQAKRLTLGQLLWFGL